MKLSLRWKIMGGFGLLLALIVLLGWVTLSLFGSLRSVQRQVLNEAVPGLVAVDEIVRSYTAQSAAVRGSLIGSQRTLIERYQFEVATSELWQERARELFTAGQERELLEGLIRAGSQFHELVEDRVIPLINDGNRSQAFRVLDQEGTRLISEIEIQGELLRTAQERHVNEAESELTARSRQAVLIMVFVLVGALGVGMLLAILLPRRLSRNLSKLVEAARAIGRGDFDQPVAVTSGDEVQELAERFTEMQGGLRRLRQLASQDRELEIAAQIQENLLQRHVPEPAGVRIYPMQRQANRVGGDWYDVDVAGKTVSLVIGDASGKGIGAALTATVALSFLRAERSLGSDDRRIVARTNDALLDATDPDSFATLIYVSLDVEKGELRWLNMGHPSPFLLRLGEGEAGRGYFLEGPRNKALGWFEDPGLAETVAELQPGDRLVFFTDGFLEAKDTEGEVFGDHRLGDALVRLAPLGAEHLAEQVVAEVERFAAGKLDDDLTMLIVEYEGAPDTDDAPAVGTGDESWRSRR